MDCDKCLNLSNELYKSFENNICYECYKKESENFECKKCKSVYHEAL